MPRQGYRSVERVRAVFLTLLCGVLAFTQLFALPGRIQANSLDNARATTNTILPGFEGASIDVFFVLPPAAQQVRPNDYIQIRFPNYSDVQLPLVVQGGFNEPTTTVVGNTVRITGIALLPGTSLTVGGVQLTNPQSSQSNAISIQITEDEAGTLVRNSATVLPSDSGNQVSITASIQSPLSAVTITGFTSPNSFVLLSENGNTISTAIAGGTGAFTFALTAQPPGAHSYVIFSTDPENRSTSQSTLNLFLNPNVLTTASGILLSPTIQLSAEEIDPGQPITVSGRAKPTSTITVFVEGPLRTYTTTTDASGAWSYTINGTETSSFNPGQYITYSLVQDGASNQSIVSPTLAFRVRAPVTNNPPPACDITRGDLNCNSVTNLVDFSILLFHWNTGNRVADINNDGLVNLVDFSIMMFYFTAS